MSAPEEFKLKLRERLLGKSYIQESVQTPDTKKPFQYWKGGLKEATNLKAPFDWSWGKKRGYNKLEATPAKSVNLFEEAPEVEAPSKVEKVVKGSVI